MKKLMIGAVLVIGLVVYLAIPYSPVKKQYWEHVRKGEQDYALPKHCMTEEDLNPLPVVLQRYFIKNGYIGVESASAVKFDFKGADFALGLDKPRIKINYTVYDFIKEPVRMALIDARMYGIPFQGIDQCKDAKSTMKGVLAKHITLFNETNDFIDPAYLSECLLHPSFALQKDITYKQIDDYSVEATIKKAGAEAKGIFHFNQDYEMTSFEVEKRYCSDTKSDEKWSAVVADYHIVNGIHMPTHFQAVWHFQSGDFVYFDSNAMQISWE